VYGDLWQQWEGTDSKVTGPSGRPGPEIVAAAIGDAIERPDTRDAGRLLLVSRILLQSLPRGSEDPEYAGQRDHQYRVSLRYGP